MKYFTIEEMCESKKAKELGIENKPDTECQDNLYWFIENVLDPIRERFGSPIKVNSGFRTKGINHAVEGKENSYHTLGLAADICPLNDIEDYYDDFLFSVDSYLYTCKFGKYIDVVNYSTFVHIEFDARRFRKENPTKDYRLLTI